MYSGFLDPFLLDEWRLMRDDLDREILHRPESEGRRKLMDLRAGDAAKVTEFEARLGAGISTNGETQWLKN